MTTDHEVAERLTDLLVRSADAVEVHPDVNAVFERSSTIPLTDRVAGSRRARRASARIVVGIAAALVLVLGVAVVLRAGSETDQSVSSDASTPSTPSTVDAPVPAGPIGFPVLLGIPEGIDDPVEPSAAYAIGGIETGQATTLSQPGPAAPGMTAVLGRTTSKGVSEMIRVDAWPAEPDGMGELTEDASRGISVAGRPAIVGPYDRPGELTEARHLIFPGEPTLRVIGEDVIELIEANPDAISAALSPEAPGVTLEITGLPDDVTVLREPEPMSERGWGPAVSVGERHALTVETWDRSALSIVSGFGEADAVDIGGQPGWIATGQPTSFEQGCLPELCGWVADLPPRTLLAWTTQDGTTVVLRTSLGPEVALAYATSGDIRLVDEADWRAYYRMDQADPLTGVGGTAEPGSTPPPARGD